MQIGLVLVLLGLLVIGALLAVFVGSLLLGGVTVATGRLRILRPLVFVVVPCSVVGALAGAVTVGYVAVRANESLILLGPVGGLLLGATAGALFGCGGAAIWWYRMLKPSGNRRAAASRDVI